MADLLGRLGDVDEPAATDAPARADEATGETIAVDLPVGPPSALAPLPIGYYVRGDKACNQIWPGEGDLAWLSAITFSIDFGGCDPGQIAQTSDTTWSERQACQTELGGEGPAYIVDYEAAPDGVLVTRARLGENALGREDRWTPCDADDVPPEARFHVDDPGRAIPETDANG